MKQLDICITSAIRKRREMSAAAAQLPLSFEWTQPWECCHPQWAALPIPVKAIKIIPHRQAQRPVSQKILEFVYGQLTHQRASVGGLPKSCLLPCED